MKPVSGHLEILDKGFGFLRCIDSNYQAGPTDTFVPAFIINKFNLREGAFVEGLGEPGNPGNQNLKLASVEMVNGVSFEHYAQTETMHTMTSINPNQRLRMAQGPDLSHGARTARPDHLSAQIRKDNPFAPYGQLGYHQ